MPGMTKASSSGNGLVGDAYCPGQCSIYAQDVGTGHWSKYCVNKGWNAPGWATYPNELSCSTAVCSEVNYGRNVEWLCKQGNSNEALLGSGAQDNVPAQVQGHSYPALPGMTKASSSGNGLVGDAYCPGQCSIYAQDSGTGRWSKYCVNKGWRAPGWATYPNALQCDTAVCSEVNYDNFKWLCEYQ